MPAWKAAAHRRSNNGRLEPDGGPVKVVGIGAFEFNGREFADPHRAMPGYVDGAVDLGRVALGSALGALRTHVINNDLLAGADLAFETACRNSPLSLHQPMPALLFHLGGD